MKKTLALVLALAMVFSTITVAFAEDTLGADAQICADLGMLKGETGTVDAAYVATVPTRLQAAVMFLRLKGLEAEALAFTGEDNFADGNIAWAEGANLLAYLKANPQLGWIGDGKNFNPTGAMTAQAYYKVLLEALGYKQNTAEVVGDFAYADVIAFAAEKGLSKVAAVENYTVNDLAIATVEALKLNVKGGEATLAATLVEAGKIDKAAAIAADLYEDTTTTTAKLSAVKAIANDKVAVTFDADVDKAFAENIANFKVVVKGSTTALEVKSADAESATVAVLTTAAQTGGTAYTLTVGDVALNFAGAAKQTEAPEIDGNVKCIDTNTVEIKFTKVMDKATAEDVANYKLDNSATVKAASLSSDRKTVTLTTEGVANNKVYKVTLSNVKSSDLVAIRTVTKSFTGTTDTKAPTINKIDPVNNQRIKVYFTDLHGVDKATAEDLTNYSINNDLKIVSIKAVDQDEDDYGYYEMVEINTDPMASGTTYKLTISKMVDGSVAKNETTKELTKDFKGRAADKTAPALSTVSAIGDSLIEILFTETNRMDASTLTDAANYTFDKDITVNSVEILNSAKVDETVGKTVMLSTSTMEKNKSYKLTVKNIADEFGNVMKDSTRSVVSQGEDLTPPYVKANGVEWVSLTKVKLTFDAKLDLATAQDPANYTINKGLGTVVKAELNKTGTTAYTVVTLTTPKQSINTNHTITINGVKDRCGNAASELKAYFTSAMDGVDTTRPSIVSIDAVNSDEVRVTFDEKVVGAGATITTSTTNAAGTLVPSGITLAAVGQPLDDETTIVFKRTVTAFGNGTKYTVTAINGIKDKYNNYYKVDSSDMPVFYGVTGVANDAPEVSTIEQVNAKKIRVMFTEPVIARVATYTTTGTAVTFDTITVDVDADNTNDAEATITLESSSVIPFDKDIKFDWTAIARDYLGVNAKDADDTAADPSKTTTFRTYIEDKDAPVIDYVEAVNENKIKVVYNEDLSAPGTYKITEDKVAAGGALQSAMDPDNDNIVFVTTAVALSADKVYTIAPIAAAKDVAGNVAVVKDVEFEFVGSSVKLASYIKGVSFVDADTIKVVTSEAFGITDTITIVKKDTTKNLTVGSAGSAAAVTVASVSNTSATDVKTSHEIDLDETLLDGTDYVVTITKVDAASKLLNDVSYTFKGQGATGGIDITNIDVVGNVNGQITFSGWNPTDYVVYVVYNGTMYAVEPIDPVVDADPLTDDDRPAVDGVFNIYLANASTGLGDGSTAANRLGIGVDSTFSVEVYRVLAPEPLNVGVPGLQDNVTWADGTYGAIRFVTAPAAGETIVIDRAPLYSQVFTKK